MARKLLPKEWYRLLSKNLNCSEDRANFIWREIMGLVVNELNTYGEIQLPNFCELKIQIKGGKMMTVPASKYENYEGNIKNVFVEPYRVVKFIPAETFKQNIKGEKETRAQIMQNRKQTKEIELEQEMLKQEEMIIANHDKILEEVRKKHIQRAKRCKEVNAEAQHKKELEENSYEPDKYWE